MMLSFLWKLAGTWKKKTETHTVVSVVTELVVEMRLFPVFSQQNLQR